MTAAERILWQRVQRRAGLLTPELAAAMLLAFAMIRENLDDAALARLTEQGFADQLFEQVLAQTVLNAAFQPVRERLRRGLIDSVRYFARDLPAPPASGPTLTISFDFLNPRVIDAVRTMETRVIETLETSIRDTVKQVVEAGIKAGVNPRETARSLRSVIGLAPNQEAYIRNLRTELESGKFADASRRALLDKRYRLEKLATMKPADWAARIDTIVTAYEKSWIAHNAETNARTASLDASRLGQRLSWEDAITKGIVDRERLMKERIGVDDKRERPEHRAINNQVRHFDERYSNGELVSGDLSWNCRCIDRYFQRAA